VKVNPFENDTKRVHFTDQTGSLDSVKRVHFSWFPKSKIHLQILSFLADEQIKTGLGQTPILQRAYIAQQVGISIDSVKTSVRRLCKKGILERTNYIRGRGESGTSFSLPLETIKRVHSQDSNGFTLPIKRVHIERSSSSFNTTTTDRQLAKTMNRYIQTYELESIGIGASDILDVWHKHSDKFVDEDAFFESIDHLGFYLRSDGAKGIERPKAWLISKLRSGYFARPAGFESVEERRARELFEDRQVKINSLREAKKAELEQKFEEWKLKLDLGVRAKLLNSVPSGDPDSKLARTLLRSSFREAYGLTEAEF
jgi:hypothetical protein